MLAYVTDLALALSLRTMQWIFGNSTASQPARAALKPTKKDAEASVQASQAKLKGYHDLARVCLNILLANGIMQHRLADLSAADTHYVQDALERAYNKDVEGASQEAVKLYRLGLNIVDEGLSLHTPSAGLGPAFSNVERWREDMMQWLQRANDRCALGGEVAEQTTSLLSRISRVCAPT